MLSWDGLVGSDEAVIECGFETATGVVGSRPQYLISTPKGMSQLTMVATIEQGDNGILDCDVISETTAVGNVYAKWTGGIGHSINNPGSPNNFTATTAP